MTLDELKAQNAEGEDLPEEDLIEPTPEEPPAEPTEPTGDDLDPPDEEGKGKEAWMDEGDESESDGDEQHVPASLLAHTRKKLKAERDRERQENEEKDRRIAELEARLGQAPQVTPQLTDQKPPDQMDFERDEDYHAAQAKYQQDLALRAAQYAQMTVSQQAQYAEMERAREQAVTAHYERGSKLLKTHGISEDAYIDAHQKVRDAAEVALPGQGLLVMEKFIEDMGEGSEKVMYYLGRNEAARNKFTALLSADKSGLKASIYLGELKAQKANAQGNISSRAPAPAAHANGGKGGKGGKPLTGDELHKQYKEAHRKGDAQKAFDLRWQAKEQKVDVSNW